MEEPGVTSMPGMAPVAILAAAVLALGAAFPEPDPLDVGPGERLLVVSPHPDDETLGAGALVQRVIERGGTSRVAIVTSGDGYVEAVEYETGRARPRPADFLAYGERRMGEARAAVRELGGGAVRLQFLGFPDGGLAPLLHAHWRRGHPERSPTTGAQAPPYPDVVDPKTAYDGADLQRELLTILREASPSVVALPDPADQHPDHSATGLFTLLALEEYARPAAEGGFGAGLPRILLYVVHWPSWPVGFGAKEPPGPDAPLELPGDLPDPGLARVALRVGDAERSAKGAALARYASQQEVMASFLAAFVRRTEPFRILAPPDLERIAGSIERTIGSERWAPRSPP